MAAPEGGPSGDSKDGSERELLVSKSKDRAQPKISGGGQPTRHRRATAERSLPVLRLVTGEARAKRGRPERRPKALDCHRRFQTDGRPAQPQLLWQIVAAAPLACPISRPVQSW
jgi:hypothetical protein